MKKTLLIVISGVVLIAAAASTIHKGFDSLQRKTGFRIRSDAESAL